MNLTDQGADKTFVALQHFIESAGKGQQSGSQIFFIRIHPDPDLSLIFRCVMEDCCE